MVGDELTGAADIATGAVIARAIEPSTGAEPVKDGHFAEGACLNCGTALVGHYCHACGQQGHLHRTLGAFGHDLLHGVLHIEGKIWKTLPMLAWRPGDLTRRYVHGERAKFVSPFALFLFSVFLMFALFSAIGAHLEVPAGVTSEAGKEIAQGVKESRAGLERELSVIDTKIKDAEAKGTDTGKLKRERANVSGMLRIVGGGPTVLTKDDGKAISDFQTGWPRLDKGLTKANENPGLMLYKLQASAYKYSWMLIPLSVPCVWLLFFWRRQYKLYDHAVFVTYSLSFLMLLVTLATVMSAIGVNTAVIALTAIFVPPIHLYRQLKQAYLLSRAGALLRTFILLVEGFFVMMSFILILLALGVFG